ncbi:hypothetical protein [Azospirillum thermophilum]|uniref:Uncharacterized protein n=1 Tax=Azospirillum thermophilum TaxID=2202148 RepID=A0A2S2CNS6_9PROT|nr:hypothetical protein [Azospirillum thermophilum]AWK86099.1 hypothetical protein DEW08_07410 [Azospirillum thermophilum]
MPTLPCPPGLLLLVLLLAGCRTAGPAPVPQGAAPLAPGTAEPLRFAELAIGSMRRGMEIGRYVWGIDCAPPYERVHWTSGQNMRRGSTFEERFDEMLGAAGFDVVGRIGGPDAPESGNRRAAFTVQGDLKEVRLELCRRSHWLTGADKGYRGPAACGWTGPSTTRAAAGRSIG